MRAVRVRDCSDETTSVGLVGIGGYVQIAIEARSGVRLAVQWHTPSQARRLAAALLKAAKEVEKKGRLK